MSVTKNFTITIQFTITITITILHLQLYGNIIAEMQDITG